MILEQYYSVNKAVGINIFTKSGSEAIYNACVVHRDGKKLTITQKISLAEQPGDLKSFGTEKDCFFAVNLTGKAVLHKTIQRNKNLDQKDFEELLPGARLSDFYIQRFDEGEVSFIAVIRRAEADAQLKRLDIPERKLLAISLGPYPVSHISSQLNAYGEELIFDGHLINRDEEGHWTRYSYGESYQAEFVLKIQSAAIEEKLLIPYAVAFQLILGKKLSMIVAEHHAIQTKYDEFINEKWLKANVVITIVVLFLLLLINFICFSSMSSRRSTLSEQVSSSLQNDDHIREAEGKLKSKEELLIALGWDGGIRKSLLIDRIMTLLPNEITLTQIAVNPPQTNAFTSGQAPAFYKRFMVIKGRSDSIIPVNDWMEAIKTVNALKSVQLQSYHYNAERSAGEFMITMTY